VLTLELEDSSLPAGKDNGSSRVRCVHDGTAVAREISDQQPVSTSGARQNEQPLRLAYQADGGLVGG